MTSDVAHSVSTTKVNFTNSIQTVSGSTLQVYRDAFDFQFASLTLPHQEHILQFDPSAIEHSSGIQVAGLLGFDILHSMRMQLDYRDGPGQVRFDRLGLKSQQLSPQRHAQRLKRAPRPADLKTIASVPSTPPSQARVTGLIDSGHLKAGSKITATLVYPWRTR